MTKPFWIYPKKGDRLSASFRRFALEEGHFVVYDAYNNAVPNEAYLSIEHIAAIVPQEQREMDWSFEVHLKGGHSFQIFAEHFVASDTELKFYRRQLSRDVQLENIYVTVSEIVMVMPVYGLDRNG
jgi:hypothetical protein